MLPLAVYEYNRPFCIRIHPRTMRNMQLYIETLGVHVEPEMKLPVQVEQTVNEQPNNSPNQAGLVVFLVGIVVLAILGFSVIGEGSGSGMSPVYLLLFLCIVGGPIFIVLSVFSLMLTKVTNTKKEMTNVQNASIQGLSTSDKWALRIFGPVFIVIGIWIPGAVSSVGRSIAGIFGVLSIFFGVLFFLVSLRTNNKEIESE